MRKTRRIVSLLLALTLILSVSAFAAPARWSDDLMNRFISLDYYQSGVTPTDPIPAAALGTLVRKALDVDFASSASGPMSREAAISALANSVGLPTNDDVLPTFDDRDQIADEYLLDIGAMQHFGIVGGSNGKFDPKSLLTYEQAASLVDRLAGSAGSTGFVNTTVRPTKYGRVAGTDFGDGTAWGWLAVPYAAPPVDELRWKAPQDAEAWSGVRANFGWGNRATQVSGANVVGSEDCLTVDIYRPNTEEKNLPVFFFLHGGNNQTGTSMDLVGNSLAVGANCVVVSVEYRLGAFGWINMPALKTGDKYEDSGNFGLLDIHKALGWVGENIANFGGDPKNITITGSSAGGRDVLAMLISPMFEGMFAKAISFSGGMTTADPAKGQEVVTKQMAKFVVEDEIKATEDEAVKWLDSATQEVTEYLYSLPAERVGTLMAGAAIRMDAFPHLFADGVTLPKDGFANFESGNYTQVPLMLVSCESEFSLFSLFDPYFGKAGLQTNFAATDDAAVRAEYDFAMGYGSMLYRAANADRTAEILCDVKGQPDVYAMRFLFGENPAYVGDDIAFLLGATHVSDMGFMTGQYGGVTGMLLMAANADDMPGRIDLSNKYQAYIGNFLRTGDPNGSDLPTWKPWSNAKDAGKLMTFDADGSKALLEMTTVTLSDDEIFALMDKDTTITQAQKDVLISTVMNGRFFSNTLDAKYNSK